MPSREGFPQRLCGPEKRQEKNRERDLKTAHCEFLTSEKFGDTKAVLRFLRIIDAHQLPAKGLPYPFCQ